MYEGRRWEGIKKVTYRGERAMERKGKERMGIKEGKWKKNERIKRVRKNTETEA